MADCSKVQLVMAALAASLVAVLVLAAGYGTGSTITSRSLDSSLSGIFDTAPPADDDDEWTTPPRPLM